jgi:hypothetical protein
VICDVPDVERVFFGALDTIFLRIRSARPQVLIKRTYVSLYVGYKTEKFTLPVLPLTVLVRYYLRVIHVILPK